MKRFIVCIIIVLQAVTLWAVSKKDASEVITKAEKVLEDVDTHPDRSEMPHDLYNDGVLYILYAKNNMDENKYLEAHYYASIAIIRLETSIIIAQTKKIRSQILMLERDYYRSGAGDISGTSAGILESGLVKKGRALIGNYYDHQIFIRKNHRMYYQISPEGREKLLKIVRIIQSHPKCSVKIVGHSQAIDYRNDTGRKAETVRIFIEKAGIDSGRIAALGMGDREVLSTPEGYRKISRIEIIITDIQ